MGETHFILYTRSTKKTEKIAITTYREKENILSLSSI